MQHLAQKRCPLRWCLQSGHSDDRMTGGPKGRLCKFPRSVRTERFRRSILRSLEPIRSTIRFASVGTSKSRAELTLRQAVRNVISIPFAKVRIAMSQRVTA